MTAKTEILPSTVNTERTRRRIRRALIDLGFKGGDLVYEHGHWWLTFGDKIFDVVDAEGPETVDGFSVEQVS